MFFLYNIFGFIIIIFSPIILLLRIINKKEDPKRFKEKFCIFSKSKGRGKLIWIHGSSVGEITSIIPLISQLEKDNKINNYQMVETSHINSFISSLKFYEKYSGKEKYTNSTINRYISSIKNFHYYLLENDFVKEDASKDTVYSSRISYPAENFRSSFSYMKKLVFTE